MIMQDLVYEIFIKVVKEKILNWIDEYYDLTSNALLNDMSCMRFFQRNSISCN